MKIRRMKPANYAVLEDFLYNAIFLPPGEEMPLREVIFQPEIYVYIDGFDGKKNKGDCGVDTDYPGIRAY